MDGHFKTIILGSGPCGLGAATRLHQHGEMSWVLIEQAEEAGGLACTDVTKEGFLFDMGGHVIFSHFNYFDELLDAAIGEGSDAWEEHQRISYVYCRNRWVPYPFQNNLYCLPRDDQITCINGLIDASMNNQTQKPETFDEWILKVMGEGIADVFMRPYNFKVWATPTTEMSCHWLGERVATVNVKNVIENVLRNQPQVGWGPNASFRFPKHGGTGAIWKGVANLLPQDHFRFGMKVVHVDVEHKQLVCESVQASSEEKETFTFSYDQLISTIPLTELVSMSPTLNTRFGPPASLGPLSTGVVGKLRYSSSHIIGFGIRGRHRLEQKCWLYFPGEECNFYRATVFSNYSSFNVPSSEGEYVANLPTLMTAPTKDRVPDTEEEPEQKEDTSSLSTVYPNECWSLMLEVSESDVKPVQVETILQDTLQGAVNANLLMEGDEIVSTYHRRLEYGYPTPSLYRDEALDVMLPALEEDYAILSRGRFGSWKYEVGNQDHSLALGVEAVDHLLFGSVEMTLRYPSLVNEKGKKNTSLKYTSSP